MEAVGREGRPRLVTSLSHAPHSLYQPAHAPTNAQPNTLLQRRAVSAEAELQKVESARLKTEQEAELVAGVEAEPSDDLDSILNNFTKSCQRRRRTIRRN